MSTESFENLKIEVGESWNLSNVKRENEMR